MKIVCLLSSGAGHLDLGGMGYLKIAQGLMAMGHEVVFISNKEQQKRLAKHGITTVVFERINKLWLIVDHAKVQDFKLEYLQTLKAFELVVKNQRPHLVIVDRILGLSDGMLNYLQIPFVSIGTPGGNWKKEGKFSIQPGLSVHDTNGHKDVLEDVLKWKFQHISIWSNSPYRCISFIGRNYYSQGSKASREVNLFQNNSYSQRKKLGISLGSGTFNMDEFTTRIIHFLNEREIDIPISVFGESDLIARFMEKFPLAIRDKMISRGYVSFHTEMPLLSHLIFAGGIGTLWYCLEYGVVPIIFSGHIHDQDYNEKRTRELMLLDKAYSLNTTANSSLIEFKENMEFSDTLDSILEDIVSLF
jgi:UDP:flavonoid glycosyltransferase YjiC (YdhE family)